MFYTKVLSMKLLALLILTNILFVIDCKSQNQELEYRSVEYYFDKIAFLEFDELLKQEVLIDSFTVAEKYFDKKNNKFNEEGSLKFFDIKMQVCLSLFKHYWYQQHIEYQDYVFVLYFTLAGFDDTEWNIVRWKRESWKNEEKLGRERLKKDSALTKLFWNYDEGPKNLENVRLFIENEYLVFTRGNLYHSLYDLRTDALIFNEESPYHVCNGQSKEEMNEWIKVNLHEKIQEKLNLRKN